MCVWVLFDEGRGNLVGVFTSKAAMKKGMAEWREKTACYATFVWEKCKLDNAI